MLPAEKHASQVGESQALEAKREGTKCQQYKIEVGTSQTGMEWCCIDDEWSTTSLTEVA